MDLDALIETCVSHPVSNAMCMNNGILRWSRHIGNTRLIQRLHRLRPGLKYVADCMYK